MYSQRQYNTIAEVGHTNNGIDKDSGELQIKK